MSFETARLRTLFIGGPGRSGTSFVADRLSRLHEVASFPSVELKFFTEKNGLLDLWTSLGEQYSPNRAVVALQQFQRFTRALIDGQFGQQRLSVLIPAEDWHDVFNRFVDHLLVDGHPAPVSSGQFDIAARRLMAGLQGLALRQCAAPGEAVLFLEKTPHALLSMSFLSRLAPDAAFLHVMRDPRSIAQSLQSMSWGPDRLEQCCAWVASYCQTWADRVEGRRDATTPGVMSLHIEDIAADPRVFGDALGTWLGLEGVENVFAGADLATLNGWADRRDAEDLALLTERLGPWISYFGYDSGAIGCRPAGPSHGQATDRPDASVPTSVELA